MDALRAIDGLVDVGLDRPNFQLRSKPFLHFHASDDGGTYADVRFGTGDFEPVWASNPGEREQLLARVIDHVEGLAQGRKWDRGGGQGSRRTTGGRGRGREDD
ncbi:MAG TPA: hypothetical protein VHT91_43975 [Kofleriaceae bacterium]|nr:hypothetical protein [Kofleriaceae bacterium]